MHTTKWICCLAAAALAFPALAADDKAAAPAGAPDMTKVGPMTKTPKNEKQDKKELEDFHKAMGEAHKKGDVNAVADMMDFPVMMMSDDSKGAFSMMTVDHDKWVAMMKPMMENMPKDTKMAHKGTCNMLSDDLASCEGEMTMSAGKMKGKWNMQSIMTRVDGKWKVKSMLEAGWGDMKAPGTGGSAAPAAPAPTK